MRKWLVLLLVISALISASTQGLAAGNSPLWQNRSDDNDPGPVLSSHDDDEDEEDDSDDNSGLGNDENDEDDEDEEDDEDDEDDDDEDEEREVKVEVEDNEVTIKLESKGPGRKDEVKVHFDADEGQMKVSFEHEDATEEEVEMRIIFHKLIEFLDTNGDGAFSPLDDEVVQDFLVEELAVDELSTGAFEVDGKVGQQVNVNYTFPGTENGNFSLVFWVFGQFTFVNGVPVRPSEAKIDIHIEDFPFLEEESSVAVGLIVKTEFEIEDEDVTFDELLAQGQEHAAFFRWADEAEVDGVNQPVTSTRVSEKIEVELEPDEGEFENKTRLFLAYVRGSEIIHDPTVGIMAITPIPIVLPVGGPNLAAFGIGLGTVILLVLGVWAFNRRRR